MMAVIRERDLPMFPMRYLIPRRLILKNALGLFLISVFVSVLVSVLVSVAPLPALGQGADYSLRYAFNNGIDFEIHFGDNGLLFTYVPDQSTQKGTAGGASCTASYDRTYVGFRHFFGGLQDNFYLGASYFSNNLSTDASCTTKNDPANGFSLLLGYHWLWGSGFNIDLGFRPGTLALGFSF